MAKACANMKPVNVGSCDAHLTRNKAYMAAIPKDERYTREDLAHLNEKWNFWLDRFGDLKFTNLSVKSYYSALCQFIKDKTGRTVGRARTMRDKRGRLKEYSSVTPLWDMVVLIKDDTTKEDVTKFVRAVQGRFHITPVMAAIHRDEGHYDDDSKWVPNLHAHIVWDRINKEGERAGRVIKLEKQDVSEIQDMAATYLGLERGTPKKITHKEHQERDAYIRKQQQLAQNKIQGLQLERHTLENGNKALSDTGKALSDNNKVLSDENVALADKNKKLSDENKVLSDTNNALQKNTEELLKKNNEQWVDLREKQSREWYIEHIPWLRDRANALKHFWDVVVNAFRKIAIIPMWRTYLAHDEANALANLLFAGRNKDEVETIKDALISDTRNSFGVPANPRWETVSRQLCDDVEVRMNAQIEEERKQGGGLHL